MATATGSGAGRLRRRVNHDRFLRLPHKTFPTLGSRALRLTLDRLSADCLLTVTANPPTRRANREKLGPAPPAGPEGIRGGGWYWTQGS